MRKLRHRGKLCSSDPSDGGSPIPNRHHFCVRRVKSPVVVTSAGFCPFSSLGPRRIGSVPLPTALSCRTTCRMGGGQWWCLGQTIGGLLVTVVHGQLYLCPVHHVAGEMGSVEPGLVPPISRGAQLFRRLRLGPPPPPAPREKHRMKWWSL